ncbi:MAG: NAD(P)H-dependent oxidoreductase [Polaribacter sp.]|uniref:NAD(P)H-dependent oxidoreductase n=1 Tax=Polaribacter sp. TaxID=1920175 RepID=UPI002F35F846
MNIIDDLKWRYAVKKFDTNKELSENQIQVLKEAFNLTATSYGLQPIKLVVIKNKAIQKKLVAHSFNQPQVSEASHLLVLCIPKVYKIEEVNNYFNLVQKIRKTPDETINPFKGFLTEEISKKTQEELFIWNRNQTYLALGNLLTVCALEKIDSCPMEGFNSEKYDEVLNLTAHNLTSTLVLPVGFRADDCYMKNLAKVRKNLTDSVIEIS